MPAKWCSSPYAPPSVVQGVVAAIREAITEQRYQPGEHLVERRVAAELGVSTIAVREAFSQLAEEGLVERRPRRGTHVTACRTRPCATSHESASPSRSWWSSWPSRTGAQRPDGRSEHRRRDGLAVRRRDTDALFDLDNQFHETFWRIAASETLLEFLPTCAAGSGDSARRRQEPAGRRARGDDRRSPGLARCG